MRLASGVFWVTLFAIGSGCTVPDHSPDGVIGGDMSAPDSGGAVDLRATDMYRPPGSLGFPCAAPTDCHVGASPACWMQQILDLPGNLPTPGGYCTANCTTDADCGGQGTCTQVATVNGSAVLSCLASCSNANTCRHPDYACWVLSNTTGYCWPSTRLLCNPTSGTGQCDGVTPKQACIRRAFEDLGECRTECALGPGTCPALGDGTKQHCVYINATQDTNGLPTRDKYKGTACFEVYPDARQENAACSYFDECMDGLQCNLTASGDKKCHTLCVVGLAGACTDPLKCKDVFNAGTGGAGLCLAN